MSDSGNVDILLADSSCESPIVEAVEASDSVKVVSSEWIIEVRFTVDLTRLPELIILGSDHWQIARRQQRSLPPRRLSNVQFTNGYLFAQTSTFLLFLPYLLTFMLIHALSVFRRFYRSFLLSMDQINSFFAHSDCPHLSLRSVSHPTRQNRNSRKIGHHAAYATSQCRMYRVVVRFDLCCVRVSLSKENLGQEN